MNQEIPAMSVEQFRAYCVSNDDNIVKQFDRVRFRLSCMKCKSEKVEIVNTLSYDIDGGCQTCGSWLEAEGAIIIKCCECGNAISIIDAEENKYR